MNQKIKSIYIFLLLISVSCNLNSPSNPLVGDWKLEALANAENYKEKTTFRNNDSMFVEIKTEGELITIEGTYIFNIKDSTLNIKTDDANSNYKIISFDDDHMDWLDLKSNVIHKYIKY